MRPVGPVTLAEAARILGCSTSNGRRYVLASRLTSCGGRYEHRALSRADVESLAAKLYDWRRHADEPDSYWLTSHQAADLLGAILTVVFLVAAFSVGRSGPVRGTETGDPRCGGLARRFHGMAI